ncbi:MAG: hypothetical protein ABI175_08200 [Polyangiales bacterium]
MMRHVAILAIAGSLSACGASDSAPGNGGDAAFDTAIAPSDGAENDDTTSPFDAARDTVVDSDSTPGDTGIIASDTATSYPAGPYGTTVGSVIADLDLEGYVRFGVTTGLASTASSGASSFGDLRAKSPKKYAVLHVSGFT